MLYTCTPALRTNFRKFCVSELNLSNGKIEQVIPRESFGSITIHVAST